MTPDASYYIRGSFFYPTADEEGRLVTKEVVGDAKLFDVFKGGKVYAGAYTLGLAFTASLVIASVLAF